MPFEIIFSPEAEDHVRNLSARDRVTVLDQIEVQLTHEPDVLTRNRKRLRPNPFADWELRVGEHRVFYNVHVDQSEVEIVAVGMKLHNRLWILGEEFEL
jgi:mRNA-degrading endonuclease RelE of RelBE toxin-antitoxin system